MIILGVDLGGSRTGLAVCDKNEVLASPAGVLTERNPDRLVHTVAAEARRRGAGMIVVGLPRNMDGSEGESAAKARAFADTLRGLIPIPVALQDERGTTITASHYLNDTDTRGKKRKAVIDTVAATVILQDFLSFRKNNQNRMAKQE